VLFYTIIIIIIIIIIVNWDEKNALKNPWSIVTEIEYISRTYQILIYLFVYVLTCMFAFYFLYLIDFN